MAQSRICVRPINIGSIWRNTEDADIGRFLRLFTDLPIVEIEKLEALQGSELNEAKKILATEATSLCHGREAAEEAAATARRTFESRRDLGRPSDGGNRARETRGRRAGCKPCASRRSYKFYPGEARRLIQSGGIRLNDTSVADVKASAGIADLTAEGVLKISVGRKKHALIKPV